MTPFTPHKGLTQAVFIGASAGGVTAMQRLLDALPPTLPFPMAMVLHLPPQTAFEPALVFRRPPTIICEANDKMPMDGEHLYFAPPGYHLLLEKGGSFSLSQDELVNYSRPSIDVFFESVAHALGDRACGILMTGANSDGAAGLREIQEQGGLTIVQDPAEAEVSAMPEAALGLFKPDYVLSLTKIAELLGQLRQYQSSGLRA